MAIATKENLGFFEGGGGGEDFLGRKEIKSVKK